MDYRLTIDHGNTTVKTAIWAGGKIVGRRVERTFTPDTVMELVREYGVPRAAIYSTVTHADGDSAAQTLRRHCPMFVELNHRTPLPIAIDYDTPATLGHDRIAAAVGARALVAEGPLLVVDAGTAITYDRVSDGDTFSGGNIAPGLSMRLQALHSFTDALPLVKAADGDLAGVWGHDTVSALRYGAIGGVIAEIDYYSRCMPRGTTVVLTGGSAPYLVPRLPQGVVIEPDLVFIGLNSILKYNEDK